jgi:hypothetical protein
LFFLPVSQVGSALWVRGASEVYVVHFNPKPTPSPPSLGIGGGKGKNEATLLQVPLDPDLDGHKVMGISDFSLGTPLFWRLFPTC